MNVSHFSSIASSPVLAVVIVVAAIAYFTLPVGSIQVAADGVSRKYPGPPDVISRHVARHSNRSQRIGTCLYVVQSTVTARCSDHHVQAGTTSTKRSAGQNVWAIASAAPEPSADRVTTKKKPRFPPGRHCLPEAVRSGVYQQLRAHSVKDVLARLEGVGM